MAVVGCVWGESDMGLFGYRGNNNNNDDDDDDDLEMFDNLDRVFVHVLLE